MSLFCMELPFFIEGETLADYLDLDCTSNEDFEDFLDFIQKIPPLLREIREGLDGQNVAIGMDGNTLHIHGPHDLVNKLLQRMWETIRECGLEEYLLNEEWRNAAVLARSDDDLPYTEDNVCWREAFSKKEAIMGLEDIGFPNEPLHLPLTDEEQRERDLLPPEQQRVYEIIHRGRWRFQQLREVNDK